MDSSPTLQDFVLNLIYNPEARTAFQLDPETVLQHEGLSDITAADVQQVIPLVVDHVPVSGITDLGGVDDLTTGVANLDVAGAVAHLQSITSQIALSPVHGIGDLTTTTVTGVNTTVVGVTGDNLLSGSVLSGTSAALGNIATVGPIDAGWLSSGHDPALGVDSGVSADVTSVTSTVDHVLPGTEVGVVGTLDVGVSAVTTVPSSIDLSHSSDLDVAGVHGATSSVVGSLIKPDLGADLTHDPVQHLQSTVTDTTHGVTDTLHSVTHPTDDTSGHDLLGGITGLHL